MAAIRRYPTDELVTSTQNGIVDVLDWLGFLCARDYMVEVLTKVHGLTAAAAATRAAHIKPHIQIARGYIQQSLDGPPELAYLPAYYAILNLSKVYILLSTRHADLRTNRTHGASYNVERKDSRTILTEVITLHPRGVFPLFYEALTGKPAPARSFDLRLSEILPRVLGISHEWCLASGKAPYTCAMLFGLLPPNRALVNIVPNSPRGIGPAPWQALTVPCLDGFTPGPAQNTLVGGTITNPNALFAELPNLIRRYLLLRLRDPSSPNLSYTLLGRRKIEFPEEVPLWLFFFYMSSIVRYKPEFFSRLKDSRYWSPVACARLHSFLDFLLAFWSFVHRKNYFIVAP